MTTSPPGPALAAALTPPAPWPPGSPPPLDMLFPWELPLPRGNTSLPIKPNHAGGIQLLYLALKPFRLFWSYLAWLALIPSVDASDFRFVRSGSTYAAGSPVSIRL